MSETKQEPKELTFGVASSMAQHREQLERKCQEISQMLSGRTQPLLPEDWTDEDAWKLAGVLAELMGRVKRVRHTVFGEENPYPSHDTPLEDIRYYNPYNRDGDAFTPPDLPVELWTEVLHCGILIVADNMDFCFPSKGTFADLEELFHGFFWFDGEPIPNFGYKVDWLEAELSEERCRKLKEQDFDPEPPQFNEPKDPWEETMQGAVYREWQEQAWLSRFPCLDDLLQAIERINSEDLHSRAMDFINDEIGRENLLCQAVDLYLYQSGASNMAMLEDSYYVAYAMLCRTQKRLKEAMEAEEG